MPLDSRVDEIPCEYMPRLVRRARALGVPLPIAAAIYLRGQREDGDGDARFENPAHTDPDLMLYEGHLVASGSELWAEVDEARAALSLEPLIAMVIIDKLGRRWDPRLHPRGRDGRFIEVMGIVKLFMGANDRTPWGNGRVTRILPDGKVEVEVKTSNDPNVLGKRVAIEPSKIASVREGDEMRLDLGWMTDEDKTHLVPPDDIPMEDRRIPDANGRELKVGDRVLAYHENSDGIEGVVERIDPKSGRIVVRTADGDVLSKKAVAAINLNFDQPYMNMPEGALRPERTNRNRWGRNRRLIRGGEEVRRARMREELGDETKLPEDMSDMQTNIAQRLRSVPDRLNDGEEVQLGNGYTGRYDGRSRRWDIRDPDGTSLGRDNNFDLPDVRQGNRDEVAAAEAIADAIYLDEQYNGIRDEDGKYLDAEELQKRIDDAQAGARRGRRRQPARNVERPEAAPEPETTPEPEPPREELPPAPRAQDFMGRKAPEEFERDSSYSPERRIDPRYAPGGVNQGQPPRAVPQEKYDGPAGYSVIARPAFKRTPQGVDFDRDGNSLHVMDPDGREIGAVKDWDAAGRLIGRDMDERGIDPASAVRDRRQERREANAPEESSSDDEESSPVPEPEEPSNTSIPGDSSGRAIARNASDVRGGDGVGILDGDVVVLRGEWGDTGRVIDMDPTTVRIARADGSIAVRHPAGLNVANSYKADEWLSENQMRLQMQIAHEESLRASADTIRNRPPVTDEQRFDDVDLEIISDVFSYDPDSDLGKLVQLFSEPFNENENHGRPQDLNQLLGDVRGVASGLAISDNPDSQVIGQALERIGRIAGNRRDLLAVERGNRVRAAEGEERRRQAEEWRRQEEEQKAQEREARLSFVPDQITDDDADVWGDRSGVIRAARDDRPSLRSLAEQDNPDELEVLVAGVFGADGTQTFGKKGYRLEVISAVRDSYDHHITARMRIVDSNGRRIGEVQRAIWPKIAEGDPDTYVYNALMELNDSARGSGFSQEYNRYMEDWYIANGITKVKVGAGLANGGYTWAVDGFDFSSPSSGKIRLENALRNEEGGLRRPEVITRINALMAEHDDGRHVTPMDIASLGYKPGARTWLGRETLIGDAWGGMKHLTPHADSTYQRASRRREMLREGKKASTNPEAPVVPGSAAEDVIPRSIAEEVVSGRLRLETGDSDRDKRIAAVVGNASRMNGLSDSDVRALDRAVSARLDEMEQNSTGGMLDETYPGELEDLVTLSQGATERFATASRLGPRGSQLTSMSVDELERHVRIGSFDGMKFKNIADVPGETTTDMFSSSVIRVTDSATGEAYYIKIMKDQGYDKSSLKEEMASRILREAGVQGVAEARASRDGKFTVMSPVGRGTSRDPMVDPSNPLANYDAARAMVDEDDDALMKFENVQDIFTVAMFDIVSANSDRWIANTMVGTAPDGSALVTPFDHEYVFDEMLGYPLGSWESYSRQTGGTFQDMVAAYAKLGPVQKAIARRRYHLALQRLRKRVTSSFWHESMRDTYGQAWDDRLEDLDNILGDPNLEI